MSKVWMTSGFEGFSQGTPGNAGHNLYVSRQGILQRIHQYDLDGDGYLDLVFCNSQDHWEKAPAYVYRHLAGAVERLELPADGAQTGVVADLDGDGYPDLVLGMEHDGIRADLNTRIYYGSPEGFGEKRQQRLPVPRCSGVAAGDFDGDGRVDLAFLSQGWLRLFAQSRLGFEPKQYRDLEICGEQLAAADLDGDGCAELVVREKGGEVKVYWGGPGGLDPNRCTLVPVAVDPPAAQEVGRAPEYVPPAGALVQVLYLLGVPHLFVARVRQVLLVPVQQGRHWGQPLVLECPDALSAAAADLDGDGYEEVVLACRQAGPEQHSWIYWGGPQGFDEERRQALPSKGACDVAIGDVDGDGQLEIARCQGAGEESFSTESLVYRATGECLARLPSEDARRIFVVPVGPETPAQVVLVNHYSRDALGNIPVSVFPGGAEGFDPERPRQLPGWGAVEALCCDVDDDGRVELVLANASENAIRRDPGSYIWKPRHRGPYPQPDWVLPTTRAHGVCCADLNRDGYLDLVFCGFNNPELLIFYGREGGFDLEHPVRLRLEYEGVVYPEPRWIYLADLNQDGWLDLVVPQIAAERSFVLWGGPKGFSMARCQALSVFHAACARAADLDGDGWPELILGGHIPSDQGPHDSFIYIYWNGPQGLSESRRTLLPAAGVNALSVADFDGDGHLDLFACSYHDGRQRDIPSYLYWNRPGRGFSENDFTRLHTHSASGCVAWDFDGDGRVDLAVANHKVEGDHRGYSEVWWNSAEGFSEDRTTRLPTSGPHGMCAVEPGNLLDRGPEEYYVSAPFKLSPGHHLSEVSWDAQVPPQSWVGLQLRCAATRAGLDQAPWQGPDGQGSWWRNYQQVRGMKGKWVQYRLALGARQCGASPRVREVAIFYDEIGV
ncbi:MAG: VCBS repeat-containing protein [Candidatus Latescibacteria bacterium]|nr:VCBS repeat-containing protein [Candidatus Latescibacterota bacterium]